MATIAAVALGVGCDIPSRSDAEDECNQQALYDCIRIAEEECGLSVSSSEAALRACEPFRRCDDAAFDECVAEYGR